MDTKNVKLVLQDHNGFTTEIFIMYFDTYELAREKGLNWCNDHGKRHCDIFCNSSKILLDWIMS